ncbi:hypothetical protein ABGB12_20625 [Actinocorallia sp. B10E7]|uniref:hypothetical protein n=1 Tax=Actinocorallia sp. B10E7 TaxID=3153558 RepID=UPI00325C3737
MRLPIFKALVGVLLLASTACEPLSEQDGGYGNPERTPLWVALDEARLDGPGRHHVEYLDLAKLRILKEKHPGRFSRLAEIGVGEALRRSDDTGIPLKTASSAALFGRPPAQAGLLRGRFDVDGIALSLNRLGYTRNQQVWQRAEQDGLSVVEPGEDLVTYAGSLQTHEQVRPPSKVPRLSGSTPHRAVSWCLGWPLAAVLTEPGSPGEADLIGAAANAVEAEFADGADFTEALCYHTTGDPEALAERLRTALREGASARTGKPWRDLLPGAEVEVGQDATVRLSFPQTGDVGVLVEALSRNDVPL